MCLGSAHILFGGLCLKFLGESFVGGAPIREVLSVTCVHEDAYLSGSAISRYSLLLRLLVLSFLRLTISLACGLVNVSRPRLHNPTEELISFV